MSLLAAMWGSYGLMPLKRQAPVGTACKSVLSPAAPLHLNTVKTLILRRIIRLNVLALNY
jgi:hypothetical protein